MPKPKCDGRGIDATLKQRHRRNVAKHMERDAFLAKAMMVETTELLELLGHYRSVPPGSPQFSLSSLRATRPQSNTL